MRQRNEIAILTHVFCMDSKTGCTGEDGGREMICDCCGKNFRRSKRKSTYTLIDGSLEEHYCSTDCAAKQLGIKRITEKKCKSCGKNLNEQTFKVCVDSYGDIYCCMACALKDNWADKDGDGEKSESVRDSE